METFPMTDIRRATIMELRDGFRGFYISTFVFVVIAGAMISIFCFWRRLCGVHLFKAFYCGRFFGRAGW
jgi:hypothetical protein